jgi:GR25 family glycosyltransferase involved in LPS biosynthesis|tara:strand:+ start:4538 stop:5389 length:852 start_codon:yes stop_codon:yes gene_type:complete
MTLGVDSTYIIHLDRQKLRKKRIDTMLKRLDLDVKFVKGIDKNNYLDNSFKFCYENFNEYFWDPAGFCTLGVLCCALSHRKAWKKFIDSGDEVGLFLEDDVRNTTKIHKYDFYKIRSELDSIEWGVCNYGRYYPDIYVDTPITDNLYETPNLNRLYKEGQISGHSYLLNRQSAQWFYRNTENITYAADVRLEISPFRSVTLNNSLFLQRQKDYGLKDVDRFPQIEEFYHGTLDEEVNSKIILSWNEAKPIPGKLVPIKDYYPQLISHKGELIKGYKFDIYNKT